MINPQLEDGYTMIANEILENMAKVKLSPTQYRILFIVWRYTYGFKRKSHQISLTFLANATGCDRRQLQRELKKLIEMRVLIEIDDGKTTRTIQFNKRFDQWGVGEIDNGEVDNRGVGETDNRGVGETDNQERKNKEINKKKVATKKIVSFGEESIPYQLALHLKKEILNRDPKTKTPDNLVPWAKEADRMLRIDKREPEEAKFLITWAQKNDFWSTNILSMKKFRQQYDKLARQSRVRETQDEVVVPIDFYLPGS